MKDTEKSLIDAVSEIVESEGFAKLGINTIAKRAGCDKVLIYRYFGGLDGLLEAWTLHNDFYAGSFDGIAQEIEQSGEIDLGDITKRILAGQLQSLRTNRMMQQLLRCEISGNSKFPHLRELREQKGSQIQELIERKLGRPTKSTAIAMQIAVLVSAIDYMVLATDEFPMMNGIDFSDERSWTLFQKTIEGFVDNIFSEPNGNKADAPAAAKFKQIIGFRRN